MGERTWTAHRYPEGWPANVPGKPVVAVLAGPFGAPGNRIVAAVYPVDGYGADELAETIARAPTLEADNRELREALRACVSVLESYEGEPVPEEVARPTVEAALSALSATAERDRLRGEVRSCRA